MVILVAASVCLTTSSAATGRWAIAATAISLPDPGRTEVAGTLWMGRIAVAGGLVAAPTGFAPTRDLFLFDPARGVWTRGPDLPGLRDHAALAALRGRLYLVGGYTTGLSGATREVWRLDSPTATWRRVADLGTPRGALAVAATRGYLIAIGGANPMGVLTTTEWYDPRSNVWRRGPDLSEPREHLGATGVRGRVYAIGGRNPVNLASVESLIINTHGPRSNWRKEPALNFARGGNGAARVSGRPCTAGGETAESTLETIECLAGNKWQHVGNLRVARHGLAIVGQGRSLYVISGGPQPGATYSTTHEIVEILPARSA